MTDWMALNAPVLAAYAKKHGLESSAFLADGTMTLIYDTIYRVEVRPHLEDRLVLHALLLDVSLLSAARREDCLLRMLRYAAATVRDVPCGLVMDTGRSRLLLQQSVDPPVSLLRLESELAGFVNVLSFWRRILQEESHRLRDVSESDR